MKLDGSTIQAHYQSLDAEGARVHVDRVNQRLLGAISELRPGFDYESRFHNLPKASLEEALQTNKKLAEAFQPVDLEQVKILKPLASGESGQPAVTAQYFDLREPPEAR